MNLNNVSVLRLNSAWMPIGTCSVKDAIVAMNSCNRHYDKEINNNSAAVALDITYKDDISLEVENMIPVKWEDWINLPIRSYDQVIRTPKMVIRAPTIIIANNYSKIPMKRWALTKNNIAKRDNDTCQYTGRKLKKSERSVDHVIPRSRGGNDTWQNVVLCHIDINYKKGDKLNSEIGYTLLKNPKEPNAVPISQTIEIKHVDWRPFFNHAH